VTISNREIRDEFKQAQSQGGGQQLGGGASASDQDSDGGSSGTGGYGNAQNQSLHQGQNGGPDESPQHPVRRELSRGERYDLEQGGGRADDAVDFEAEVREDRLAPEDRGQAWIDAQQGSDGDTVTDGQQP
jgi:hypothetical protein